MKLLVVYDTTNGDILRVLRKNNAETVLASGSGTLNNTLLTGSGFSAIPDPRAVVAVVVLNGRTMRSPVQEIVSDTQVFLGRPINTEGQDESVTYGVYSYGDPDPYSDQERDDEIDSVKTEVGHQNVSGLKVDSKFFTDKHAYYVDISDGNKLKRIHDRFVYE